MMNQEDTYTRESKLSGEDSKQDVVPGKNKVMSRRPSRVPSMLWIVALVILAIGAIAAHGVGLHSLATFSSMQQHWKAEQSQRESVRMEWKKLIDNSRKEAASSNETLLKLKAELKAFRANHQEAKIKFTRANEELRLVHKARDAAIAQQQKAETKVLWAIESQKQAETQLVNLTKNIEAIRDEISKLTLNRTILKKSLAKVSRDLTERIEELKEGDAQLKHMKETIVSTTQKTFVSNRKMLEALTALNKAQREIAVLKEKKAGYEKLLSEKDVLETRVNALTASIKVLTSKAKTMAARLLSLKTEQKEYKDSLEAAVENTQHEQRKWLKAWTDLKSTVGELAVAKKTLVDVQTKTADGEKKCTAMRRELAEFAVEKENRKKLAEEIAAKQKELSVIQKRIERARYDESSLVKTLRNLVDAVRHDKNTTTKATKEKTGK